jgi:hypothetical protein
MTAIVFAGPSLFGADTSTFGEIDLRPPAGKGDLLAAALAGASAIGLVDGTFEFGAATWHKEILCAIDRGVLVFGAASMGALRAAECAAFGMVGIGRVYADYAEGRRQSDADVAIMHAPAALAYRPLSEALVDMDATLDRLSETGALSTEMAALLGNAARAAHFKDRTWPIITARAGFDGEQAGKLLELLRTCRVSVKTADALALIAALQDENLRSRPAPRLPAPFNRTMFFESLLCDIRNRR